VDCRIFDEQVVRHDPQVADLMDQFICVRVVQGNAMDLTLFQFDYDLTFSAFFMNADRTIYGRFGSRSDRKDGTKDVSMEGFRKALAAALDFHKGYPANKALLGAKQPRTPRFKSPEEYPALHGKYKPTLDYEGKVVQSCMHCHQLREAERLLFRADAKPIPDDVLYPWPMPNVVGLEMDPKQKATVAQVQKGSVAERAGFKNGDEIVTFGGQSPLSTADLQWVLENAAEPATIQAEVLRDNRNIELTLRLEPKWRRAIDLTWRATTWDLRRMTTGGLVLKQLSAAERKEANLSDNELGLRVEYVGQFGDHAIGKKAGFQKNDIIITVDGQKDEMSESQLFGYLLRSKMPGTRIPMVVLRGGQQISLEMLMQ
jgi:serine protease Do